MIYNKKILLYSVIEFIYILFVQIIRIWIMKRRRNIIVFFCDSLDFSLKRDFQILNKTYIYNKLI